MSEMCALRQIQWVLSEMDRQAHWAVSAARVAAHDGKLSPGAADEFVAAMVAVATQLRTAARAARPDNGQGTDDGEA